MRFLRTCDGARIGYWLSTPTSLQGALVLLHGAASNHTRWSEFCRTTALRENWALLRPELRGQGASLYRGRMGMDEWCADLAALLDAESLSKAVIAGHCLGANLALRFAAHFPARTAGLVLIEPMLPEALAGTMRLIRRLRPVLFGLVALTRSFNALGLRRRRLEPLDLERLDRETRAAIARGTEGEGRLAKYASPLLDLRTTATGAYLQALLAVTEELPAPDALATRVLALVSERSTFTDPAATQAFLERLPDCEIVTVPARHWIPTEQPQAMRAAIEDWLRRCFPGGA
ncbi:MAG: alpha/beta fold hydrolase [Gammaproteobacteria bacterium]